MGLHPGQAFKNHGRSFRPRGVALLELLRPDKRLSEWPNHPPRRPPTRTRGHHPFWTHSRSLWLEMVARRQILGKRRQRQRSQHLAERVGRASLPKPTPSCFHSASSRCEGASVVSLAKSRSSQWRGYRRQTHQILEL